MKVKFSNSNGILNVIKFVVISQVITETINKFESILINWNCEINK